MSLLIVALVTFLATAYLYVKSAFSYWKRKGVPFVEPSFPLGNAGDFLLQRKQFGEVVADIYNGTDEPVIGFYTALRPNLLIRDPKIIKDICIKNFQSFNRRIMQGNVEADPMSDNLLLQHGDRWKQLRTQFTPAFSTGKLKGMFDAIVQCGGSLDKHIGTYADTDKSVEIRDVLAKFATNAIASVAFGIEVDSIENPDCEFRTYGQMIFTPSFRRISRAFVNSMLPKLSPILGIRFVDKEVSDFMIETVRQNLEYREKNNVSRKDFFQLLMQLRNTGQVQEDGDDWSAKTTTNEKSLTLEQMAAQAFLFFGAGFESSSSTISFCMYELAKNPSVQQKVYDEIVTVLQKHDGQFTYDSVADMKYIDSCLDESLRLHPPFPMSTRKCTKAYKIPDTNITIDEGTAVIFSTLGLQYDPKYYDEPRAFKPERYSEAKLENKTFEDMPNFVFGEGPRSCIGMRLGKLQAKIALILLLRKYNFKLDDIHKNTELKLNPASIVLSPVNGLHLKVFKR